MVKKGKKLQDVIDYLDGLADCKVVQLDAYLLSSPNANKEEEIYAGTVMDIPWYMTDYYLANDSNGEAIHVWFCDDKKTRPAFIIYVVEDLERLGD